MIQEVKQKQDVYLASDTFPVLIGLLLSEFVINTQLPANWLSGLLVVLAFTVIAYLTGKIDAPGAVIGGIIAACILLGAGMWGLVLLGAFFTTGTMASVWKMKAKQQIGLAEANNSKRSVKHAFSNGGISAICGLLAWLIPENGFLFQAMLAGSLASATADTLASELGNVIGSRYFNIITFRPEHRGPDGVISPEGSWAGALGSIFIAFLFGIGFGWGGAVILVALAGITGNILDSVLGATLQRKGYLNNHAVNFANTCFAALFVGVLFSIGVFF